MSLLFFIVRTISVKSDFWRNGTLLWYVIYNYYCNQFLECNENEMCIDIYYKQSLLWYVKYMAHCYNMWNTIINAINICNTKKMNSALMFIMNNHYGNVLVIYYS